MNSEQIISQYQLAIQLSLTFGENRHLNPTNILDVLASSGLKLAELEEKDFDEEGVSLVSKAYMYSVFEKIEGDHLNIKDSAFADEDQIQDFDDYIEDDLDPEEFYDSDKDN